MGVVAIFGSRLVLAGAKLNFRIRQGESDGCRQDTALEPRVRHPSQRCLCTPFLS